MYQLNSDMEWMVVVQFVRALNAVELVKSKHRREEGHSGVTVIRLAHTILVEVSGRHRMSPIATVVNATAEVNASILEELFSSPTSHSISGKFPVWHLLSAPSSEVDRPPASLSNGDVPVLYL